MENHKTILLAHGGGGRLMNKLIKDKILRRFKNETLNKLGDSAELKIDGTSICFTTDSFVVKPLFFPGGDIGKLAVCGTVNDLAVAGAKPVALSLSLLIEEGFELKTLDTLLDSIARTAKEANVEIVTGDTKVVEKGSADGLFINTAGIGQKIKGIELSFSRIEPGDKIIINGTIGDHGMAVISKRQDIGFDSPLVSDCACLNGLVAAVIRTGADIKFMRDPTRGGLATVVNEIAENAGADIELSETDIPASPAVRAAADMLGFDLLNVANEGKVIFVVSADSADTVVNACKAHPLGQAAAVIGQVVEKSAQPLVEMFTAIGGKRIVQTPYGQDLPRIC